MPKQNIDAPLASTSNTARAPAQPTPAAKVDARTMSTAEYRANLARLIADAEPKAFWSIR